MLTRAMPLTRYYRRETFRALCTLRLKSAKMNYKRWRSYVVIQRTYPELARYK